jgi:hypothetical protein
MSRQRRHQPPHTVLGRDDVDAEAGGASGIGGHGPDARHHARLGAAAGQLGIVRDARR